jgi:Dolichyl-phosphate-mannose-protein mannosyltransferase
MTEGTPQHRSLKSEIIPIALLLTLALLFFLSYFNRFAGLRSGDGEFGGGIAILVHRLPYRDYYTAGPPLNAIKSALELGLFGKTLFVSRLAGVFERLLIALALYLWLRRLFSARAAMLASLTTIIVSAGDRTDPLASYNHDAIFLAILAGLAACISLDSDDSRRAISFAAFAGIAASLSLLFKQTVGLGAAASVGAIAAIAVFRMNGARRAALWCSGFLGGLLLPLVAMAAGLAHFGVLRACLTMLFVSGPAAKASGPVAFLHREWVVAAGNPVWIALAIIAMVLSARVVWRSIRHADDREDGPAWLAIGLGGLAVVGTAEALALTSLPSLRDFGKSSVYFVIAGSALLGISALLYALRARREDSQRVFQVAIFAALSWSVAATLSLSWPAFEAMTLPGLGLLLAAAIDGARPLGRGFLYLVMGAMIFIQVREKLDLPFAFDHQEEAAVHCATYASSQPMLRLMRLPEEEVRLLDDVTAAAKDARSHGVNSGFTYPEMSLIYPLSGLQTPTRAGSHNIDVVQDTFAREEAVRLLNARPAVIVYSRPSESDLRADEAIWRNGRSSGQRDLVVALDRIVASYRLVGTYSLRVDDNPIRLYVRDWVDTPH